jgi:Ca2+-binding EF-hand superfamily protein
MKNTYIKVLGDLSNEEHKALLLELPQTILDEINIDQNGCISSYELLNLLIKEDASEITDEERMELMFNIFDPNRAVNL